MKIMIKTKQNFTPLEIHLMGFTPFRNRKFLRGFTPLDSKHLTGFTLIEILVAISIIAIIIGISFSLTRLRGGELDLQRNAQKLALDLRRAQGMAVATKLVDGTIYDGYGIYFNLIDNDQKYKLYVDNWLNLNQRAYDPGEEEEEISLDRGIYIKEISYDGGMTSRLSVNFRPPDPETTLTGEGGQITSQIKIIIALRTEPTKERKVIVSPAGKIEIE